MKIFKDGVTTEQKIVTWVVFLPVLPLVAIAFGIDRWMARHGK